MTNEPSSAHRIEASGSPTLGSSPARRFDMSIAKVLLTSRVAVESKVLYTGGKLHVVSDSVGVVVDAALEKAAARSGKELIFDQNDLI